MSVDPKDTTIKLMFSGCLSLPDFKKTLPSDYVEHDLSTLPTTPLALAAV